MDVMAGIRRAHSQPPRQKEALFADDLVAMLATLPNGPSVGIRRPPRFLEMTSRTLMVPDTRPCASRTIDQSRPAISQAPP
jgi:hypothetical protein